MFYFEKVVNLFCYYYNLDDNKWEGLANNVSILTKKEVDKLINVFSKAKDFNNPDVIYRVKNHSI